MEAFIKIVKRECLKHPFASLEELKQTLAKFVTYYNRFRLHSSLGYQTPVSRFLGVECIQDHGLAGIPGLPKDLSDLFPPAKPVHLPSVNLWSVSSASLSPMSVVKDLLELQMYRPTFMQ